MTPSFAASARTVVVADDAAFVRDRFQTALGNAGHRAIAVRTAADLLAQVRASAREIDLIVIDLQLPGGGGIELVKALRQIPGLEAPIVIFSGTVASADEVRELAALGVGGYINEYTSVQHIVRSLVPHLFPELDNRRTSPRVVLSVPISYQVAATTAVALTLNISNGGLAVRTTSPLNPGTDMTVRFRLPGATDDLEAAARVAWVDRRVGMGVKFTRVGVDHQAAIDEFVGSHLAGARK